MKRMRILIISNMYPSKELERDGIFIVRQVRLLTQYGIDCVFLVPRPWAPWPLYLHRRWKPYGPGNPLTGPEDFVAREVRYFRTPGEWFCWFEGHSVAHAVKQPAARWHAEEPFDLVWGVAMLPDAVAAVAVGKMLNIPVASLAVGGDVMVLSDRRPELWRQLGKALSQIDLPLGVSQMICDRMWQTNRCVCEPKCIYLGRDTKQFRPVTDKSQLRPELGFKSNDIVGVFVGKVADSKGINELATVLPELLRKHKRFKVVCVGSGPAEDTLIRAAEQSGRTDGLLLTGLVEPDQVPRYLQSADFLIFPSHTEGMPQAVLEAMNCKLGVIGTRVGGVPEAVLDGDTGILIDAKNTEQLYAAVDRMILDEDFRMSAAQRGLAVVEDKFNPEKNAKKLADALWRVVS